MSAGESDSSGNADEKYDLIGKKYACIFCYDSNEEVHESVKDTNLMIKTFRKLNFCIGCETDHSGDNMDVEVDVKKDSQSSGDDEDEEEDASMKEDPPPEYSNLVTRNLKARDLFKFVRGFVKKRTDACCFAFYFIVKQQSYALKTVGDEDIPLFQLWKQLKGSKCPILFFIEPVIKDKAEVYTVLFNSEEDVKGGIRYSLPKSANMLLAYLPKCVSGNGGTSVAKILSEELCKPFDINTSLTNVIERLNSQDCWPSPKFSSTLLKQLYLTDGLETQMKQEPKMYDCKGNLLVFAFLFCQFKNEELLDLTEVVEADAERLEDHEYLGFQFENCFPEGKITLEDFKKKLKKILEDKSLDSCDCIMIIMSTHGDEGGKLHAYDGTFSLEDVWRELSHCKKLEGKPKVLLIDACRGKDSEELAKHTEVVIDKGGISKSSSNSRNLNPEETPRNVAPRVMDHTHMRDMLIAMGTIEGKKSFAGLSCGSFFTKYFCEQIKTTGGGNILTILNSTMHNLARETFEKWDEKTQKKVQFKQQVTFTSTLQKLLYISKKKIG